MLFVECLPGLGKIKQSCNGVTSVCVKDRTTVDVAQSVNPTHLAYLCL